MTMPRWKWTLIPTKRFKLGIRTQDLEKDPTRSKEEIPTKRGRAEEAAIQDSTEPASHIGRYTTNVGSSMLRCLRLVLTIGRTLCNEIGISNQNVLK